MKNSKNSQRRVVSSGGKEVSPSLAAVIPLIEKHVQYFFSLVSNLELQTRSFDEVIVVASGLSRSSHELVEDTLRLSSYSHRYQILSNPLSPSGRNRNVGAEASSTDLIAFLDADDTYHPLRNEVVLEIYRQTRFDALLMQAFALAQNIPFGWNTNLSVAELISNSLIYPQKIFDDTFSGGRARHKEMLGAPSVLELGASQTETVVPHGHLVALRDVFLSVKQHEWSFPRNEDSVFARDILWSGRNLFVLNVPLSHYRFDTSSNNPRRGSLWNLIRAFPRAYLVSPVAIKGIRPGPNFQR